MNITQIIIIYLVTINIIGFLAMGIDKLKAKSGRWRIPENTLFTLCLIGGGVGTISGMYIFHHKTQKPQFKIGMPCILVLEILIFIYFRFVM